jgi:hypothetical protein
MMTVLDDDEVAPPTIAPAPSTISAKLWHPLDGRIAGLGLHCQVDSDLGAHNAPAQRHLLTSVVR